MAAPPPPLPPNLGGLPPPMPLQGQLPVPLPMPMPIPIPQQPLTLNNTNNTINPNSITTLSKLNPTTVLLTHIPPFLRHPRNLRDLLYSTTNIKHLFYSCAIKRFANDVGNGYGIGIGPSTNTSNGKDSKKDGSSGSGSSGDEVHEENVVAVVKFSHAGNALSLIRNWKYVQLKLNQKIDQESGEKDGDDDNNNNSNSKCNMDAFLLYSDGPISLHPEKSQVDAGMIESIWDLTNKKRDTSSDAGKVAQQADDNMIHALVNAYRAIEKRQKDLDRNAAAGNDSGNGNTDSTDSTSNAQNLATSVSNDAMTTTTTTDDKEDTTLKLDSAKVRAAAGGGAYDEEADPLNAPEVLEAVAQFKKRLEITQGGHRRKRKEFVEKRLKVEVQKAKERLIQRRKEMEERKNDQQHQHQHQQQQNLQQLQQLPPPPPLPPMNFPPPPLPPGGLPPPPSSNIVKTRDTGRRGVSNLPAWMTAAKKKDEVDNANADSDADGESSKKRSADGLNEPEIDYKQAKKMKFIPSEVNRDINTRKERLIVNGTGGEMTSLAAIRAANEAADKAKEEEEKSKKKLMQEYIEEANKYSNDQILNGFYPKLLSPEIIPTIRMFVKEQMVEYLGEEEATLIDYVMNHLVKNDDSNKDIIKGKTVDGLLEEMKEVLDEDAETFVIDLFKKVLELCKC